MAQSSHQESAANNRRAHEEAVPRDEPFTLVDNENSCALSRCYAIRRGFIIADIVAHARLKLVPLPILVFDRKLAIDHENDVTLVAPMVCNIVRAVGH